MSGTSLSVAIGDGSIASIIREVLVSLPVTLQRSQGDNTRDSIVAISGTTGWVERATQAAADGAVGLVVIDPNPVQLSRLDGIRELAADIPVVLDRPYVSTPSLAAAAESWHRRAELAAHAATDTSFASAAHVHAALFRQLSVLQQFVGRFESVSSAARGRGGYSITGYSVDGTTLVLGGIQTRSNNESVSLRIIAPPTRLAARAYRQPAARPVEVSLTDGDGRLELPSIYESTHRASWRRAAKLVTDGQFADDCEAFIADVEAFELVKELAA